MAKVVQSAMTQAPNSARPESPSILARAVTGRQRMITLGFTLAGLVALYWGTAQSMVSIWWRSDTFAHGFFILPISLFLIWRNRREIARTPTRTDFRALAALVPLGFGWLLADTVDVLVVKQYAFVAMIPVIVWLFTGWAMIRTLAFPLGFLLLAVPVGEGLILPMMKMTAAFTVYAVQFSGVPVYWEGFYLTLPSGSWNIVEGCSGVRYLIASVTVGILYAYLTYRSFWRRIAFVALSIVSPIIANWLRAYMIVMIGHLSEMKLATGVDHILYGWVFFGIVMLVLFWIGSYWREDISPREEPDEGDAQSASRAPEPLRVTAAGLVAVLLVIGMWPSLGAQMARSGAESATIDLSAPAARSGWRLVTGSFTDWKPRYINATAERKSAYKRDEDAVGLYLAYYSGSGRDSELVNSQNVMIEQKHPVWRQPYQRSARATINGEEIEVLESELESSRQALLAWYWYWVAGQHTANPYEAKIREAVARIIGADKGGFGLVVFTQRHENRDVARAVLRRFLEDMSASLETTIESVAGR